MEYFLHVLKQMAAPVPRSTHLTPFRPGQPNVRPVRTSQPTSLKDPSCPHARCTASFAPNAPSHVVINSMVHIKRDLYVYVPSDLLVGSGATDIHEPSRTSGGYRTSDNDNCISIQTVTKIIHNSRAQTTSNRNRCPYPSTQASNLIAGDEIITWWHL